jgi:hypothetical protein
MSRGFGIGHNVKRDLGWCIAMRHAEGVAAESTPWDDDLDWDDDELWDE